MAVDFETKCYENDWEIILDPAYLKGVVDRCAYQFSKRRVIINNVSSRPRVEAAAMKAIELGALDEYVFAQDRADQALDFFRIDRNSFGRGYVYSICELVGLYVSSADYLLHFASDSYPMRQHAWLAQAIELMQSRDDLVTANLCWNERYGEAARESFDEAGDFLIGYGFSDQCYLAKLDLFRTPMFNERNTASERYPDYADELFEKRVDAYMRNHQLKRMTHRQASYRHRNIPKSGLGRAWRRFRPLA